MLKPTAAESGWSNGIVKRHNAISGKTIDVIIAWFVNVKNSLHICCGYSSNQHVFGHNSSLSFFLVNNLSAMEETSRELLRKHMNVMYDSQKAFTESESNQKLGRAIWSKLQSATSLTSGDHVFSKRKNSCQWKGTIIVTGRKNKQNICSWHDKLITL